MPVARTSSTAASVAMLRAFEAEKKLWNSSTENTTISATRIRPIDVVDPVRRRCHAGARRAAPAAGSSGGRLGVAHGSSSSWNVSAPVIAPTTSSIVTSLALEARDPLAEAQDLDAVGDLEDLGHVVADEHDGEALVAHAADQVEDVAGLDDAERGRRLVHEDDLARPRDGAADRDALALAARHVGDRARRCPGSSRRGSWNASSLRRRIAALSRKPSLPRSPPRRTSRPRNMLAAGSRSAASARSW